MFDRNVFSVWRVLLALSLLFIWADSAMAYVGPGTGLEFIPYFLSLAVGFGIALSAVLLWPFYALIRFIRGGKAKVKEQPPADNSTEEPRDKLSGETGIQLPPTSSSQFHGGTP